MKNIILGILALSNILIFTGRFHDGVRAGNHKIVRSGLRAGKVNEVESGIGTALHSAILKGNLGIVQLLVEFGADKNNAQNLYKTTPLHLAIRLGKK